MDRKKLHEWIKVIACSKWGGVLTSECSTIKSLVKKLLSLKELVFGIEDNIKKKIMALVFIDLKKNIFNRDGNIIYTLYSPYGYIGNMRSTVPLEVRLNIFLITKD